MKDFIIIDEDDEYEISIDKHNRLILHNITKNIKKQITGWGDKTLKLDNNEIIYVDSDEVIDMVKLLFTQLLKEKIKQQEQEEQEQKDKNG